MILDDIVDATRARVAAAKKAATPAQIRRQAEAAAAVGRAFAFERALWGGDVAFICEVKRASPSKGVIARNYPYAEIAEDYERAGAAAISVLTEPDFFMGDNAHLKEIKERVALPVLRKDFIIDEYQIYEARAIGADAVLLICNLLDGESVKRFLSLADSLGLSCLVETHDEAEVGRALAAGARVVGVNNRDLRTFEVDIDNSLRLRKLVPPEVVFVSESGVTSARDVERLREAGVDAVLVGESLMRGGDKVRALGLLRSGGG